MECLLGRNILIFSSIFPKIRSGNSLLNYFHRQKMAVCMFLIFLSLRVLVKEWMNEKLKPLIILVGFSLWMAKGTRTRRLISLGCVSVTLFRRIIKFLPADVHSVLLSLFIKKWFWFHSKKMPAQEYKFLLRPKAPNNTWEPYKVNPTHWEL